MVSALSAQAAVAIGVSVTPGCTTLRRMPSGPSSRPRHLTKYSAAPLGGAIGCLSGADDDRSLRHHDHNAAGPPVRHAPRDRLNDIEDARRIDIEAGFPVFLRQFECGGGTEDSRRVSKRGYRAEFPFCGGDSRVHGGAISYV